MEPLCADCRYFAYLGDCNNGSGLFAVGECRVNPPTGEKHHRNADISGVWGMNDKPVRMSERAWPITKDSEWCGAFYPCRDALDEQAYAND